MNVYIAIKDTEERDRTAKAFEGCAAWETALFICEIADFDCLPDRLDVVLCDYDYGEEFCQALADTLSDRTPNAVWITTGRAEELCGIERFSNRMNGIFMLFPLQFDALFFMLQRSLDSLDVPQPADPLRRLETNMIRCSLILQQNFWKYLISQGESSKAYSRSNIRTTFGYDIKDVEKARVLPLLSVFNYPVGAIPGDYIFATEMAARAVLLGKRQGYTYEYLSNMRLTLLFPMQEEPDAAELMGRCIRYSAVMERACGMSVCSYIGEARTLDGLSGVVALLMSMDGRNVTRRAVMCARDAVPEYRENPDIPNFEIWAQLIREEELALVHSKTEGLFRGGAEYTPEYMSCLLQDFMQMACCLLKEASVSAHTVLSGQEFYEKQRRALRTVDGFVEWADWVMARIVSGRRLAFSERSLVGQAKRYIDGNLSQKLTREEIATQVHVSQNYLARVFRQETGDNMSGYIMEKRLEMAMELLRETKMRITDISMQTGFSTPSYFTACFRNKYGLSPSALRSGG